MKRRVVITGAGIVSAIGTSTDEFWHNCLAGRTVVEAIPSEWREYADFKSTLWSPLPAIDYAAHGISRAQRMHHDPVALNAILAAREALDRARLAAPGDATGVYIGTGIGGSHTFLEDHLYPVSARNRKRLQALEEAPNLEAGQRDTLAAVVERMPHPRRINPFMASMYMPNTVAASLGIHFSLRGPNLTFCQACASGTVAVGQAYRAVRDGAVNTALAGGSEYFHDRHGYLFQAFDVAGTLVRDCAVPALANCPFDVNRSGFLFSQGASAILTLESYDQAMARRAPILAEVSGYAESFDAHSMMAMAPGGERIETMISNAVLDAGLRLEDIDYINAHGTGTTSNDAIEANVLGRLFGDRPRVNATKSLLGHTIGASGAVEAAVLALSLRHQTTHANNGLRAPIAELNFVNRAEACVLRHGLSESFAFGGHNAALVMGHCETGIT